MVHGFPVDATAIYDDGSLVASLGVSCTALSKARKAGRLRFTRQGQRTLYLGRWVLEWLETEVKGALQRSEGAVHSEKKIISVPTAAQELGVSTGKVTDWIKSGELPSSNLARKRNGRPRYGILRTDLEEFLRGRRVVPNGEISSNKRLRQRPINVKKFF